MRIIVLTLTAALLAACFHAEMRPAVVVGVEHGDAETALASGYDESVAQATRGLNASDPLHAWRMAMPGEHANHVVRHVPESTAEDVSEFFANGDVYVSPARVPNGPVLVRNIAHGLVHAEYPGVEHVCREPGELPDARHPRQHCTPGRIGASLLNPRADYRDDNARVGCYPRDGNGNGGGGCSRWPLPTDHLTPLDVAAIRARR